MGFRSLDVPLSFCLLQLQLHPYISQLNSTWELRKMKGLKLEELWLDGNPLCGTFPDQSTYIWSVQNLFTLSGYLCTLGA